MADYKSELNRMQELIGYNINETKVSSKDAQVEFHQLGADGKTYGIIKEGTKYYIKVAPKKDTEILAEDYDYIGGFMNKKDYEYSSYPLASKQFDLKIMSINEACADKKETLKQFKPVEEADWVINETKEMRSELDRFNQLSENVNSIIEKGYINEDKAVGVGLGKPNKKEGPYTENGETKDLNKKVKTTSSRKEGVTDGNENVDENPTEPSTKGSISNMKPGESTYTEKPKKVNEKRNIKINEEQVLAWQHERAFVHHNDNLDRSQGTEIGDSAPYNEKVGCCKSNQCKCGLDEEEHVFHNTDSQNTPKTGVGPIGDKAPWTNKVNEDEYTDDIPFPEVEDEDNDTPSYDFNPSKQQQMNDMWDMNSEELPTDVKWQDYDDAEMEANGLEPEYELTLDDELNETELHDFGKHPAYRKSPFTLPKNADSSQWGEDWNDDSTKGEQPFGQQIGSGDPYTEKVIDMLTDAVMDRMYGKKKL